MQTSKISVVICALLACAPLTMHATDTPAQAAARAQVVEKLKELEAQSPETNRPAPPTAPTVKPPVMAAPVATTVTEPTMKPVKKVKPTPPVQTPAPVMTPVIVPVMTPMPSTGSDIGLKPVAAPALPIAASKEARLQALLAKYQADQISPEEYHKQRAAILAAP